MENLDLVVLRALLDWRRAGRHALLATVVRTWGSSPRPVGSTLALRDDGALVGSVSGGCIEDDLIARYARDSAVIAAAGTAASSTAAAAAMPAPPWPAAPVFVRYGVDAEEAHRFGLPCGGTLELLLEFDPDADSLAELVALLGQGRLVRRRVALADGRVTLVPAAQPAELSLDAEALSATFGPEYRLLLIGAGQLAEYLAVMARFSGFAVTVCDPRAEYRGAWSVEGVVLTTAMPDDAVTAFRPDRRSAVVALTHDPKLDDLALLEALRGDAFYVGAIGSRRNNAARRRRLVEHFGETEASLARLRGPIGIHIGSRTPPEIAVSVMAEILAVKNGVPLPRDMQVAAAKDRDEQAAGSGR